MSSAAVMAGQLTAAALVSTGDYVRRHDGEPMKVLASYADVGGASSAATTWCVEGYVEGQPTSRIRCDPGQPLEVLVAP